MQIKFLDGGLEGAQQADGKADTARGLEDVDAAAHATDGPGKVERAALKEVRPFFLTDDPAGHFEQRLGGQRFPAGAQRAADAQRRREPGFQVQVAGAVAVRRRDQGF